MDNCLTKTCTKCCISKPLTEYYKALTKKNSNPLSGYKSHCKNCISEQRREYYKTPKGRKAKIEHAWNSKGMDFTVEKYEVLMQNQNGVCAICGVEKNRNGSALCVDHNHETGSIRGLLCHFCNTAIGKFNDDVQMLEKAIQYLKQHQGV